MRLVKAGQRSASLHIDAGSFALGICASDLVINISNEVDKECRLMKVDGRRRRIG
mgnify:CR=1 FL=1